MRLLLLHNIIVMIIILIINCTTPIHTTLNITTPHRTAPSPSCTTPIHTTPNHTKYHDTTPHRTALRTALHCTIMHHTHLSRHRNALHLTHPYDTVPLNITTPHRTALHHHYHAPHPSIRHRTTLNITSRHRNAPSPTPQRTITITIMHHTYPYDTEPH